MRPPRFLISVFLIIGLLLSPLQQAMACAMEDAESAGSDVIHAVNMAATAESTGTDDAAPHNIQDSCTGVCACACTLTAERMIHIPAGAPSIDDAGQRLLDPPLFRQLRPPRPASV